MGYFSELSIDLDNMPRDREDPFYANRKKAYDLSFFPEGTITLWDMTDEELYAFKTGQTTTEMWDNISARVAETANPKDINVYQKKRLN